ncbi:hypothetical protein CMALT430_70066 [Carnobacterium maltaromaticum]|uniref:acyl-CoA dehydrogenase family protein n=1 Tax=Carnobacterium maltaromaticum TaxID=2751 RepID=UPI00191B99C2|nr:acyl-CoA dehydrogenase family protein [Carnobacterium maltaromaticum]CAD5901767.1 hypothetical protein CMALT430_70066 [Carnobacterium maltaromaticum]
MSFKTDYLYNEFMKGLENLFTIDEEMRITGLENIGDSSFYTNDTIKSNDKKIATIISELNLLKISTKLEDGGLDFGTTAELDIYRLIAKKGNKFDYTKQLFLEELSILTGIEIQRNIGIYFLSENNYKEQEIQFERKTIVVKAYDYFIVDAGQTIKLAELHFNNRWNINEMKQNDSKTLVNRYKLRRSMEMLSLLHALIEETVMYTNQRNQFGKKIIENQFVSFEVAKIYLEFSVMKLFVQNYFETEESFIEVELIDTFLLKVIDFTVEAANKLLHFNGSFGMTFLSNARKYFEKIYELVSRIENFNDERTYFAEWRKV